MAVDESSERNCPQPSLSSVSYPLLLDLDGTSQHHVPERKTGDSYLLFLMIKHNINAIPSEILMT